MRHSVIGLVLAGVFAFTGNGGMAFLVEPKPSPLALPGTVTDLRVLAVSDTSVALSWTEVNSGNTAVAKYSVRYGPPIYRSAGNVELDFAAAADGCGTPVSGSTASGLTPQGAARTLQPTTRSCVLTRLTEHTAYAVQLVAFTGAWGTATNFGGLSNVVLAITAARHGPLVVSGMPAPGDTSYVESMSVSGYPGFFNGRYPVRGSFNIGSLDIIGYVGDSVTARGYLFVVKP